MFLSSFFKSLYLSITFFVLHKSLLTRDLPHSLFQMDFKLFHALSYSMYSVRSIPKEQNQKKGDKPIKPGH